MAATEENELPAAIDQLYRAVGDLVDPVKEMVQGRVLVAPSAYEQLVREIPATRSGDSFSRGVGRSLPPVYCDAVDLQVEIDSRTAELHPEGQDTPQRLRGLAGKRWRPQDTRKVRDAAEEIAAWRVSIRALTDPERVKTISAPCPACGRRWHYRQNAGETVRVPTLQLVIETGCRCLACGVFYPPDRYLWLVKLMGFDTPAGVVD